jgi:hypothetical protein
LSTQRRNVALAAGSAQSPWQPEGFTDRVLRNTFTTGWDGRPGNIEEHRAELRRELEAEWVLRDRHAALLR